MADSADITKTTDLPKQEPRQPSPVESQSSRVESPVTPSRVERPPTPPPSTDPVPVVPIPTQPSAASDAIIAQKLAAPVSAGSNQPGYSDIEAIVTDIFKNVTINGYATSFQNGNLDIQLPASSLSAEARPSQQSAPHDLSTTSTPPPSPAQPAAGSAIGTITPATAANMAAGSAQQEDPPPSRKPGEEGFFYGHEENRRPGESYVSQVSRERREASGEALREESFIYGREENRRPGESYVDQVSRERKEGTTRPLSASSSEGVYTEDRPQDEAAAEQQSNMVGNRRMGDYGRRENRREDESYSDQVTREYSEDRDERRRQREDRQAQRDRFDPMSRRRQRGESREEYRERKEKIESFDQKAQEALRNGDTTLLGKGYVPVLFSRADQQRKVLLRLDVTHSTVIEGAAAGERTGSLPSQGAYYLGGGGGSIPPHPWQVLLRTVPETDPPVYEYKIDVNSTLYRGLRSFSDIAVTGLDSWEAASTGYLYLFGTVEDGVCTEASIQGPEDIPSDRIDFVSGKQNSFSAIIAYLYEDGDGGIAVQQRAFHDFTLINTCVNGLGAIYPIPT